jgi:hypothetical protein
MALAALMGIGEKDLTEIERLCPKLLPEDTVLVGIRVDLQQFFPHKVKHICNKPCSIFLNILLGYCSGERSVIF